MTTKTRKEIISEYKQHKSRMGVYQIRNTVNNKRYVEGSIDIDAIYKRHTFELNHWLHRNILLQREWTEFGESSFECEILDIIKHDETQIIDYKKETKKLATFYIEELQPFGINGYNTKPRE